MFMILKMNIKLILIIMYYNTINICNNIILYVNTINKNNFLYIIINSIDNTIILIIISYTYNKF
jgi:hypothetical protein